MSAVEPASPILQEPLPGFRLRVKNRWRKIGQWWRSTWANIRPGPEARKGAAWALLASAAIVAFVGGYYLRSGFGLAIDLAFAFLIAGLGIPLAALLIALILTIFRKLPRLATGFIVGACLFVSLPWPDELGIRLAIAVGVVEGFLGASLATLIAGNFRRAARSKQ